MEDDWQHPKAILPIDFKSLSWCGINSALDVLPPFTDYRGNIGD